MDPFTPMSLGAVTLSNRLLMAPVKTGYGTADGEVTSQLIDYFVRRAKGGVGAIIVEPCYVDRIGKEHPHQLGISNDNHLPGLRKLVDAIHAHGAKAIAHLNHAGRAANPKASGQPPEAPSPVVCPTTGVVPIEMTHERIVDVIDSFQRAALRAYEAGFDAIEVQCGMGYLVSQFLSPRTNFRLDEFGCTDEEPMGCRFLGDIFAGVRCAVGKSYPVTARISASEEVSGGLTVGNALKIALTLRGLGAVAIHVASGSACDSPPWYYQHMGLPENANLRWASEIQSRSELPVIVAGRMGVPAVIREAIGKSQVAAVALGRPLVADPDLPNKMKSGDDHLVIECGACLQGCLARVKAGQGLGCIVNPLVGREKDELVSPADFPRRIVIVGGEQAGMTAAPAASRMGHEVVLFESNVLGGQFALAPRAPGKEAMRRPLESLIRNIMHSNAEIRTGRRATVAEITNITPDLVLMATGATPLIPHIEGADNIVSGNDILSGAIVPGQSVLVIGGGLVGIECAEYLLERDRQVTVVEMLDEIARDMEVITKSMTLRRLEKTEITIYTDMVVDRIESSGQVIGLSRKKEVMLGRFDTIVAAVGTTPVTDLADELHQAGVAVKMIGDARHPGQIIGATQDAFEAVRSLTRKD